jgi:putative AdoMet-dependent methyltransferase
MSQNDRVQLFDQWALTYDQVVPGSNDSFPFAGYEQILDEVVKLSGIRQGMQVLELGIGTGNLAMRFIQAGCVVWGIDFSSVMLSKARIKVPQVMLFQADLLGDWSTELQRPFDRVVSAYVFHEFDLESKVRLLQKIASHHLSPGGSIVVADIAFSTVAVRKKAFQQWANGWDEDEFYWAADETRAACEQVGLHATYQQVSSCGGVFTFFR